MVLYGILLCGILWYYMVFYGITWYLVYDILNINQLIRLSGCGECTMINGF